MDGAHISIDGLTDVLDSFQHYGVASRDMRKAMRPISRLLANKARTLAPRQEGYLRRSIRATTRRDRASAVAGGRYAYFAPVVHFGWRRHGIEPQHFMFTALDAASSQAERMMVDAIRSLAQEQGLHITL
ncbi:MAG: hypothetical protein PUK59_07130 [Actinomycetaceae bacterium]|nr:hypothetical protein [Actinomycetaceae bacterium]MDY5854940.1 hypothetical protein [Arcanobacterium sp.]